MQSVCSVLPPEFNARVIEARALFAENPAIGVIYDPPFAHFTHQLAEDYDWDGLEAALAEFAARQRPFEVTTTGILSFTGRSAGAAVAAFRSEELLEYHDDLWKTITPFAKGRVDSFYETRTLVPHVTIKRCGTNWQGFGEGMARLAHLDFQWTTTIDNVSVQHDPGRTVSPTTSAWPSTSPVSPISLSRPRLMLTFSRLRHPERRHPSLDGRSASSPTQGSRRR
jgi:2'-5' RNA ligase